MKNRQQIKLQDKINHFMSMDDIKIFARSKKPFGKRLKLMVKISVWNLIRKMQNDWT